MRDGISKEVLLRADDDQNKDRERSRALDNHAPSRARLLAVGLDEGDGQRLLGARLSSLGIP